MTNDTDLEIQVKKVEEKYPLTETKRLIHITNFLDYATGVNYKEYEVNDFLCNTDEWTNGPSLTYSYKLKSYCSLRHRLSS